MARKHRRNEMSRLWYDHPAKEWEEALPIGNGRIGTMVYGGTDGRTDRNGKTGIFQTDGFAGTIGGAHGPAVPKADEIFL